MNSKLRIAALAVTVIATTIGAGAETRCYKLSADQGSGMTIVVDSVEYRSDLTRVYGHIDGEPHRAHRIDRLVMTLPGNVTHLSDDIDGIDYNRWFQWENTPSIDVEIDFPKMKPTDAFILEAETPKGAMHWEYIKHSK